MNRLLKGFGAMVALVAVTLGAPQPVDAQGVSPSRGLEKLVAPLWRDLALRQRKVLQPFEAEWNGWSAKDKKAWLSLADRFPRLSEAGKARAQRRIRQWAALSPEQRRVARANYRMARQLPANERVVKWLRYRQMTPEQRAVLRRNGSTSNTAARFVGPGTGLAKDAAQPLSRSVPASNDSNAPISGTIWRQRAR